MIAREKKDEAGVILVIGYSFACRGLTFVLVKLLETLGRSVLPRLRFVQLHPPKGKKKPGFVSKQTGEEARWHDTDWMASYSLLPKELSLAIVAPEAALRWNMTVKVGKETVLKRRKDVLRETVGTNNLVCVPGTTTATFEAKTKNTAHITREVVAAIVARV